MHCLVCSALAAKTVSPEYINDTLNPSFAFRDPFDIFREFFGGNDPFADMFHHEPFDPFADMMMGGMMKVNRSALRG